MNIKKILFLAVVLISMEKTFPTGIFTEQIQQMTSLLLQAQNELNKFAPPLNRIQSNARNKAITDAWNNIQNIEEAIQLAANNLRTAAINARNKAITDKFTTDKIIDTDGINKLTAQTNGRNKAITGKFTTDKNIATATATAAAADELATVNLLVAQNNAYSKAITDKWNKQI